MGDFNVDGLPDLAVANSGSNNVSVLLGNGDGSFQAVQNFEAESRPFSIAVADFNGDGLPDSWPTPASSLSQILRFLRVSSRLVLLRHPF